MTCLIAATIPLSLTGFLITFLIVYILLFPQLMFCDSTSCLTDSIFTIPTFLDYFEFLSGSFCGCHMGREIVEFTIIINPICFNFFLVLLENLNFHPCVFLLFLFFISKNEEAKAVGSTDKPRSIAGSILDGLKGIARWLGDKIKGLLGAKGREIVWVILKKILTEILRPILIIAALGCWVFCYSLAVYLYVIYSFGDFGFWNLNLEGLLILFGQAFGKAYKSVLLLELFRSSAFFLLLLVAFLKKFG